VLRALSLSVAASCSWLQVPSPPPPDIICFHFVMDKLLIFLHFFAAEAAAAAAERSIFLSTSCNFFSFVHLPQRMKILVKKKLNLSSSSFLKDVSKRFRLSV